MLNNVGDRTPPCGAPVLIFLFNIFIFISIFILLTRRKATEALIHRVGNYPDASEDTKILLSACNLIEMI